MRRVELYAVVVVAAGQGGHFSSRRPRRRTRRERWQTNALQFVLRCCLAQGSHQRWPQLLLLHKCTYNTSTNIVQFTTNIIAILGLHMNTLQFLPYYMMISKRYDNFNEGTNP